MARSFAQIRAMMAVMRARGLKPGGKRLRRQAVKEAYETANKRYGTVPPAEVKISNMIQRLAQAGNTTKRLARKRREAGVTAAVRRDQSKDPLSWHINQGRM